MSNTPQDALVKVYLDEVDRLIADRIEGDRVDELLAKAELLRTGKAKPKAGELWRKGELPR